tara:strand:- start:6377 stop:8335 length:1959 start_codon:yes stop_codon:yes gene_type:complete
MSKKILVRGPAMSLSGYGEQCRFALRSLRAHEEHFDIYLANTGWGNTGFIIENDEERQWIDEILKKTIEYTHAGGTFDMSLQVTIPNEWEQIAPINVGYTAGIETTKVAPQWIEKAAIMDRIIVVSNHAKEVYENTTYQAQHPQTGESVEVGCTAPIHVVNYPVMPHTPTEMPLELEHDFNFLTIAQWGPRKNLDNTIRWFVEEFIDQPVGLVVKTFLQANSTIDQHYTEARLAALLKEYPDRKCKVYLLHGSLTNEQMSGLYQNEKIKALVNLSHGEGFGLSMFEAATYGKPVVSPNWSGQNDYLYAPVTNRKTKKSKIRPLFAKVDFTMGRVFPQAVWEGVIQPDSQWCYPDPGSYKMTLRKVYKQYNKYVGMANKLKKHVHETFSKESQYKLFAEATLGTEIQTVDREDLPKISVITSVYNGDDYIKPFLEDMVNQTIFDKCELILVNANSPGSEEEVIREYMDKHDNIIYKKLDEDPGIYGTWNEAIKLCTGEYITNANLDDRKAPDSVERHAKELYLNPDVDLVYSDSFITDQPNETFNSNSAAGRRYNFLPFSFENLKTVNMPHNNPMWRADIHEKCGEFDDKYRSAGDWEFWLRAASQGSKFKKINDILGLYYFNPEGVSTNPDNFEWKMQEEQEVYNKYKDLTL